MGPKGTGGFWPLGFSPGGWAACPWCPDHPGTVAWAQHGGELGAGGAGQSQEPLLGWGEREVLGELGLGLHGGLSKLQPGKRVLEMLFLLQAILRRGDRATPPPALRGDSHWGCLASGNIPPTMLCQGLGARPPLPGCGA